MTDKITPKKTKKPAKPKNLEKDLVEKNTALEAQILYAKAESENNRKRALEEAEKTRKYAIENFSQEIYLLLINNGRVMEF